jgi:hypothetical protein
MKSPPVQFSDEDAHKNTEAFIAGESPTVVRTDTTGTPIEIRA